MGDSNVLCGTSGWAHAARDMAPAERHRRAHPLEFVAQHFDAVEISESFSQFLRPEITRVWLRKVQDNPRFEFTAKLHRRFTHDRMLDSGDVAAFKEGLWPLLRSGKLGCLLLQFPWSFRFTAENRDFLRRLRRTFHEFPMAAEMRHSSWTFDEAIGTFIDFRLAFCNIDQPSYTKAMPPTAFLTSSIGYVRLHGRNSFRWFGNDTPRRRYDYLYSGVELSEWKARIDRISGFASKVFVIMNNDEGRKSVINGLQLQSLVRGGDGRDLPPELLRMCPHQEQDVLFKDYARSPAVA